MEEVGKKIRKKFGELKPVKCAVISGENVTWTISDCSIDTSSPASKSLGVNWTFTPLGYDVIDGAVNGNGGMRGTVTAPCTGTYELTIHDPSASSIGHTIMSFIRMSSDAFDPNALVSVDVVCEHDTLRRRAAHVMAFAKEEVLTEYEIVHDLLRDLEANGFDDLKNAVERKVGEHLPSVFTGSRGGLDTELHVRHERHRRYSVEASGIDVKNSQSMMLRAAKAVGDVDTAHTRGKTIRFIPKKGHLTVIYESFVPRNVKSKRRRKSKFGVSGADAASKSTPKKKGRSPKDKKGLASARNVKFMLLHRLCDDPSTCLDTARCLKAAGYTCLLPHLPGHGDSRHPRMKGSKRYKRLGIRRMAATALACINHDDEESGVESFIVPVAFGDAAWLATRLAKVLRQRIPYVVYLDDHLAPLVECTKFQKKAGLDKMMSKLRDDAGEVDLVARARLITSSRHGFHALFLDSGVDAVEEGWFTGASTTSDGDSIDDVPGESDGSVLTRTGKWAEKVVEYAQSHPIPPSRPTNVRIEGVFLRWDAPLDFEAGHGVGYVVNVAGVDGAPLPKPAVASYVTSAASTGLLIVGIVNPVTSLITVSGFVSAELLRQKFEENSNKDTYEDEEGEKWVRVPISHGKASELPASPSDGTDCPTPRPECSLDLTKLNLIPGCAYTAAVTSSGAFGESANSEALNFSMPKSCTNVRCRKFGDDVIIRWDDQASVHGLHWDVKVGATNSWTSWSWAFQQHDVVGNHVRIPSEKLAGLTAMRVDLYPWTALFPNDSMLSTAYRTSVTLDLPSVELVSEEAASPTPVSPPPPPSSE